MPSLLKTYSLNTGFKIRKLKPMEAYFPVPEKYVTIQTSSGMGSKNYDLWIDVINSIYKNLKKHGYEILHIGKDGVELPNTKNLLNSTNFHQVNYIIRNSSLHIGNDSFAVHLAGLHEIPIVAVYGPTTIDNHGPHFKGKKTFLIESHRNGKNPTFSAHEEDKTINLIKSEEIVNNIYKALEIDEIDDKKTLFVGKFYPNRIIEIVPNCLVDPRSLGASEPVLRCDIESNDEILFKYLQNTKCSIITNNETNIDIYKNCRNNISKISFEITKDTNIDYVKSLINTGVECIFYTNQKDKLNELRFDYLNVCEIHERDIVKPEIKISDDVYYFSSKVILSNNKVYPTIKALKEGKNIESFLEDSTALIELDDCICEDINFLKIFKKG